MLSTSLTLLQILKCNKFWDPTQKNKSLLHFHSTCKSMTFHNSVGWWVLRKNYHISYDQKYNKHMYSSVVTIHSSVKVTIFKWRSVPCVSFLNSCTLNIINLYDIELMNCFICMTWTWGMQLHKRSSIFYPTISIDKKNQKCSGAEMSSPIVVLLWCAYIWWQIPFCTRTRAFM